MKTELRKDQTRRPRVKCKSVPKSASAKTRKKSSLAIALKLYAEYNRDKTRTMTGMKTSRVRSDSNGSKASGGGSGSSGNQNSQHKVSICPVKRPISSIVMGIVPNIPTTRSNNTGNTVDTVDRGVKVQPVDNTERRKAILVQSSHSVAVQLLTDMNEVFRKRGETKTKSVSKLRTTSLLSALCTDRNKPWASFCKGRRISARRLNTILQKEFGIHSKDIRFKAGVFKGFYKKTIVEACRPFKSVITGLALSKTIPLTAHQAS